VERLRTTLRRLKTGGSAILVVGRVPATVAERAASGLFGTATDRRRVVVRTGDGRTRPTDGGWVVDWQTADDGFTRSAAAGDPPPDSDESVPSAAALTRATLGAIDDAVGDTPDPGRLRVGVGSLVPLLVATSEETAFRVVHVLTGATRNRRGICHVHLPVARDAELVRTFEPLFDVTVEVRETPSGPSQRWHVHSAGVVTDWLHLDDVHL
jgi:hypothetical protein